MTRSRPSRTGVVYDTGALFAGERGSAPLWSLHHRLLDRRIRPVVPSIVLARAWRGGPQANLARLLKGCVVEALAENAAREIGGLLAASGSSDLGDAAVVVSAARRGDLVVTSDPGDLTALASVLGTHLMLHAV